MVTPQYPKPIPHRRQESIPSSRADSNDSQYSQYSVLSRDCDGMVFSFLRLFRKSPTAVLRFFGSFRNSFASWTSARRNSLP